MRIFLFLSLAFIFSCNSNLETIETKDEDGYLIKYSRKKDDYAKEGLFTKLYPSGTLYEEANYVNDTLHGERKLYYKNGKLEILETYDHGNFTSPYKRYYDDGQLQLDGFYEDNKATGVWTRYYKNGQIKDAVTLVDNDENGPFTEYYENGNLKAEGTYNGTDTDTGYPREHGLLKMYDESGELVKKMDCIMGRCKTIWTKEAGDVPPKN
jgi:antitoxin component YwqK of YwqJK toxin-antitoxin module